MNKRKLLPAVRVVERPILFSGRMVLAIIEDRKTQTRRVIKPQPSDSWMNNPRTNWAEYYKRDRFGWKKHLWVSHPTENKEIICPYGAPGEHLWVREKFCVPVVAGGKPKVVAYAATEEIPNTRIKWKPSIFMPRALSRIKLQITNIRVQRLMDISNSDILAEGITEGDGVWDGGLRAAFANGWNEINQKRGFSWLQNPWVWVVEFRRLK